VSKLIPWQLRRPLRAMGLLPPEAKRPDEDTIYRQLGRFVVTFQGLENELVQLASYALDPAHGGHQARLPPDRRGRRRLVADLWFHDLLDKTSTIVGEFLDRYREDEPEFRKLLDGLLDRCRELAHYRNRVVHSAYLFLEGGDELVAIVRSDMTAGPGDEEVELDQELLTEDSFKEVMGEIAELVFAIGQCRLQLIHWYP
jgi:hypothetical protein